MQKCLLQVLPCVLSNVLLRGTLLHRFQVGRPAFFCACIFNFGFGGWFLNVGGLSFAFNFALVQVVFGGGLRTAAAHRANFVRNGFLCRAEGLARRIAALTDRFAKRILAYSNSLGSRITFLLSQSHCIGAAALRDYGILCVLQLRVELLRRDRLALENHLHKFVSFLFAVLNHLCLLSFSEAVNLLQYFGLVKVVVRYIASAVAADAFFANFLLFNFNLLKSLLKFRFLEVVPPIASDQPA